MTESLLGELRRALVQVAGERGTITYLALAERIGMPGPRRIHRLTLALEAMVAEDHRAGRPLLAALAIGRGGDQIPGRGFFQLIAQLERYDGPDRGAPAITAHQAEKQAAWNFWGES